MVDARGGEYPTWLMRKKRGLSMNIAEMLPVW